MKQTVAIIGSSISGALASAYLKKKQPDLDVHVISKGNEKLPIVGESLTEFTTHTFHELGLGPYLEQEHYHKYGLTFNFKEDINNPECRRYASHEAHTIPPMPSNQLNRFTFDDKLRSVGEDLGVEYHQGSVKHVDIRKDGGHNIHYTCPESGEKTFQADWVVDTSGRRQVLANQLHLKKKSMYQRGVFWFRLVNFDQTKLAEIEAIKPPQCCFDSYFVTHHFFGQGNWIWCIPMRTKEYDNMISIGIVWRPDIYKGKVRCIDSFLEEVGKEHPVVNDLVRSGEVLDTSRYENYLYESSQVYSEDGWFIVGDAADSVDPLYSTGLVMTSLQITQVNEIIRRDRENALEKEFVTELQGAYKAVRNTMQMEISTLYEVMHDTYQSHWRMHMVSTLYFFSLLPAWLSGYMIDKTGARFITKLLAAGEKPYMMLLELLEKASERKGRIPSEDIENMYYKSVNWDLWGPCDKMIPKYMSRMYFLLASFRFQILRDAGWYKWPTHLGICALCLAQSAIIRVVFWRSSFKSSPIIKWALNIQESRREKEATKPELPSKIRWRPGYTS